MESKKWWESKTIWSGVVAVLIVAYNATREQLVPSAPEIPEWVFMALAGVGIYGRAKATTTIK